jgi:hypothetical protein
MRCASSSLTSLGQIGHTSPDYFGDLGLAFPNENAFRYRPKPTVVLGRRVNDKVIEDVHDWYLGGVYRLT